MKLLVVGLTGALGALVTKLLLERADRPVALVASSAGRAVFEREVGPFATLAALAAETWADDDLFAPYASGSVATAGMVVLPCSANTLGKVAFGLADSLILRAAHCRLKERERLVLCVRETPWTLATARAAVAATESGAVVMPVSPPFYMARRGVPFSMEELLGQYVDRVLALFDRPLPTGWADVREAEG